MTLRILIITLVLWAAAGCDTGPSGAGGALEITHGPMLGRLSSDGVGIWARTSRSGSFQVRHGTDPAQLDQVSEPAETTLDHDNTGWAHLTGLASHTKYYYELVLPEGGASGLGGSFHTLPTADDYRHTQHNPDGLFNFRFEFACGNNQNTGSGSAFGAAVPTFATMKRELYREQDRSRIDFAILNGDWLYEEKREYSPDDWLSQVGADAKPRAVELMPTIAGVWENYKLYLSRADNLAAWHRVMPTFYTFDDHEIVNDVYGSGEVGRADRRAVFRDIGVRAWYDYLGWSNPVGEVQALRFGRGSFQAGSDVLTDAEADFSSLKLGEAATLHVHWGTPDGGVMLGPSDTEGGDPNAGVYEIVEVIDGQSLRIRPAAKAAGEQTYSIGRVSYYDMQLSNAGFFFLDTRTYREMHDVTKPAEKGRSMLGARQKKWLKDGMGASDADYFVVVSSVNFMIPHVGGTGAPIPEENKDDAWTVFLDEREELINFWDSLGKPVFVLTGDLHNSFAIKITDRVWEFASGPHNSMNHPAGSEGDRPINGAYDSRGRKAEIRW